MPLVGAVVFGFIGNRAVYALPLRVVHVAFWAHHIPLTHSHDPMKIVTTTRATPKAHDGVGIGNRFLPGLVM